MKELLDKKAIKRFWSKVDKSPGNGPNGDCWLWTAGCNSHGYGDFRAGSRVNGSRKSLSAHRVSYVLHFGEIPEDLFVCHHCDTPKCVNPNHLFAGTPLENTQNATNKNRFEFRNRSVSYRTSKIPVSDDTVHFLNENLSQYEIARMFEVSQVAISKIINQGRKYVGDGLVVAKH